MLCYNRIVANEKKTNLLGVKYGTACSRLRKQITYYLAGKLQLLDCFRCGKPIEDVKQFSVEHKAPWMAAIDPTRSFFDIENIAFSHASCNSAAASRPAKRFASKQEQWREAARRQYADPVKYENHLAHKRKQNPL